VETRLTEKISDVKTELTGKIAETNERISQVETRLTEKISETNDRISQVETRLTEQITDVKTELTAKISETATILQADNKRQFKWFIGVIVAMFGILVSLMLAARGGTDLLTKAMDFFRP